MTRHTHASRLSARNLVLALALLALAGAAALTWYMTNESGSAKSGQRDSAGGETTAIPSPTGSGPSASVTPPVHGAPHETSASSPTPPGTGRSTEEERQKVAEERARAAPVGDPAPTRTDVPGPNDYGFGAVVDKGGNGEVAVYKPVRSGDELRVPVTITNYGNERAEYTVEVLVTGSNGFRAIAEVHTAVTGVSPGSTWPEESAAVDDDHPLPDHPTVKIVSVRRDEMP